MRKVICLLGLLLCVSLTASAQDSKFDIFVGFNYLRISDGNYQVNGNNATAKGFGASGAAAYNLNHWFAVAAEVGYDHYSNVSFSSKNVDAYTLSYLVGPKVTPFRFGGVAPFAQVLMGGIHPGGDISTHGNLGTGFTDAFAMAAGGGVDWNVTKRIGIRLAQVDYLLTRIGYNNIPNFKNQNNFRYSGGVVIRLGGK